MPKRSRPTSFLSRTFGRCAILLASMLALRTGLLAAEQQDAPLAPAESLKRFKVADDLEIEQVLAEPVVRQPVHISFDERGRLWVVQYIQYPDPAGLKLLSKDEFWRAAYDRVPPAPPNHFKGEDKITIHEDTDGDGTFDKHKTFVEGLSIATSVARGRGGVWVLNPPYLQFYADRDTDDVPDGDPETRLEGFGLEDTHAVANSLTWGSDGWLYGAQGSTVASDIRITGKTNAPVHTIGQLIWRYHPEARRYEVFSEGGGNAFGVEIDSKGRTFSGHNGGNTRGFHYMQGAYLQKGFEKHGPLSNPYAFGYFPPMKHPDVERFTHTFLIYEGSTLPERYSGKLLGVEPLQGRIVMSELKPDGSTFKTEDIGHPVTTTDAWFRPVDIKLGPDGALYVADWYDQQVNHYRNHEGKIDKSNGRIYRIKSKGAKPIAPFDLAKASSAELVVTLQHTNRWFRNTAVRLLGDRRDGTVQLALSNIVVSSAGQLALDSFWALNYSGGLHDPMLRACLAHTEPSVRGWAARLIGDLGKFSPMAEEDLVNRCRIEPDIEVRAQLACTARRLVRRSGLRMVRNLLARSEDRSDPRIPLLLWWAIEAKADLDRAAVIGLFREPEVWDLPMVQEHVLPRIVRRYAAAATRIDLLVCAELLQRAPTAQHAARLMTGFDEAMKGRPAPSMPDELLKAMAKHGITSIELGVRSGDATAVAQALKRIADDAEPVEQRIATVQMLGEVKQTNAVPALLALVKPGTKPALQKASLTALAAFDGPAIAAAILERYDELEADVLTSAQMLLSSRESWALQWLTALDTAKVRRDPLAPEATRRARQHKSPQLAELAAKHFDRENRPARPDLEKQIAELSEVIRNGSGNPYEGRKLFEASCASCHKLFGKGGEIGPDLTSYKRDDLATMLLSVVNPSAEIREGFASHSVTAKDGRVANGFIVDRNPKTVVLRGVDGQNVTFQRDEIEEMTAERLSLMPEGLLDGLSHEQVRNLFAFLRSTQPLPK